MSDAREWAMIPLAYLLMQFSDKLCEIAFSI